eukprot:CAMPEP_0168591408 /NCGR_PEP_ID=MMETSP0420-20121227/7120_1 /TAXON_ID=498008 /ORGANISM="Pessonella sp." /LENGTH=110 /DNA_ID=CAMNT_0008627201 /DNA_START=67 /DNA_END=399 /DNA_ORIENTATION=+
MPRKSSRSTVLESQRRKRAGDAVSGSEDVDARKRNKRVRRPEASHISFSNLDIATLRVYASIFDLRIRKTDKKADLVDKIEAHFATLAVDENTVISYFLNRLKKDFDQMA